MDVLLVGFIGGFVAGGWRTGFLRRLIGLGFAAVSLVASAYFRYPVGAVAGTFFKSIPPEYANLVGYAIAFPAILAGLHLARRAFMGRLAVGGMAAGTDRALGALFGGLEAVVILSAAVVVMDTYAKSTPSTAISPAGAAQVRQLDATMNAATTVRILRATTVPAADALLGPILPHDLATLTSGRLPGGLPLPTP